MSEFKYKINEKVYVLSDNKIYSGHIIRIEYIKNVNERTILKYDVGYDKKHPARKYESFSENEIFINKEDLIKSLQEQAT